MNQQSINIPTLHLRFSLPLRPHQIPRWRGAVAEAAGWEHHLFHNHRPEAPPAGEPELLAVAQPAGLPGQQPADNEPLVLLSGQQPADKGQRVLLPDQLGRHTSTNKFMRYPLVQYRVERGQAALFGIGQGVEAIRAWVLRQQGPLRMGGRSYRLQIVGMQEQRHCLQMLPAMQHYRIMDYLPFKQENYRLWQLADDLHARVDLLQRMLTGHILGFASAMNYSLPARLEVRPMAIRQMRSCSLHGIRHLAFNLIYKANINLPSGLGLGRGVSHGFGVQMPCRQ